MEQSVAEVWLCGKVNCCEQALTLKFRVLANRFKAIRLDDE